MYLDENRIVLEDIRKERLRQEILKSEGRFKYTCADPEMTHMERLAVIAEEFGEAAHEVNETISGHHEMHVTNLRKELIQIAAVACAWVEAIDNDRSDPRPNPRWPRGV